MFDKLNVAQLRKIIRNYNLHTVIKYSKMKKDELIKAILSKMSIDADGNIQIDPNTHRESFPEVKQPRRAKPKSIKSAIVKSAIVKPKVKPIVEKPKIQRDIEPESKYESEPEEEEESNELQMERSKAEDYREQFYGLMSRYLNSPSKRTYTQLKQIDKGFGDLTSKILNGRKGFDFIPTPKSFYKSMLEDIKSRKLDELLEPCCGFGNVIHEVLKVNPKMKIDAYEYNHDFVQILNVLFPKRLY